MNAPVLLLVFKRPEVTRRAVEAIRAAGPSAVYISGDGARPGVVGEAEAVDQVWDFLNGLDWDIPVHVNRYPENVGSLVAVTEAISWFFENEPFGVIIEDDILIEPRALPLASRLLREFADDTSVGSITMFNPVPARRLAEPEATYRRSNLVSSEFWGTWRDRWSERVFDMSDWRSWLGMERLEEIGGRAFAKSWEQRLDAMAMSPIGSWEWRWLVTHWVLGWDVIVSNRSYSFHLDFSETATSFTEIPSWYPSGIAEWRDGFVPPQGRGIDYRADAWHGDQFFGYSLGKRVKRTIGQYAPGLRRIWLRVSARG